MKKIFNRRAKFDYEFIKSFEAGIVLIGPEVKSIKAGHIKLTGSFVRLRAGQAWLHNAYVSPYPFADNREYDKEAKPSQSRVQSF